MGRLMVAALLMLALVSPALSSTTRGRLRGGAMTRVLFVFAVVSALAGCARVSSTLTYLPDGRQGYVVDCSYANRSWGDCYQKAGELCDVSGYDVIAHGGDQRQTTFGSPYGVGSDTIITRSLVIACKR
jgi:hypothetical protein